jgi:Na+-transporting NADH:ubiquinone oxidoreductase subunit A
MPNLHIVRNGLDLPILGAPEAIVDGHLSASVYAVRPSDFRGLVPKLAVKEGDRVLAGDILFTDKANPQIAIASPVSGEVARIERGDKRKILAVVVLADAQQSYRSVSSGTPANREDAIQWLVGAGAWSLIESRPYGRIANPEAQPKAVFVNGMATEPLAVSPAVALAGREEDFAKGLQVISLLSPRTVLSIAANETAAALTKASGVEIHQFKGPHPSGTTSVHINRVSPINKGETVWTLNYQDVAIIGHLARTGNLKLERVVSLCGTGIAKPRAITATAGAQLETYLSTELKSGAYRVISGSVLTGANVGKNGYLGYYASQITAIPEGQGTDFFGWVIPSFGKWSISRTLFSWLNPSKKYDLSTKQHGEDRAFVVTGVYDKVFPLDILPMPLIKAMWAKDLEKMEQLGAYEVVAEDFALCEVVCPSKQELQKLAGEAIDLLYTEMN